MELHQLCRTRVADRFIPLCFTCAVEARRSRPAPVAIAQLTDTHVVADDPARIDVELYVDNNARLAAAVEEVMSELLPVDLVLGTGDLTNDGRPEEYDALRLRIEPIVDRWLPLPGNHDSPDAVRATFPEAPWADTEHASWAVEIGSARIVGLDSTRPTGRSSPPAIHHGGGFDMDRAETGGQQVNGIMQRGLSGHDGWCQPEKCS